MKAKRKLGKWPKPIELDEVKFNLTATGRIGIIAEASESCDCEKVYQFINPENFFEFSMWILRVKRFVEINTGRFEE